jgi:hypothetical protein
MARTGEEDRDKFHDDHWPIGFDKNGVPNVVAYIPPCVQKQRDEYLALRRAFEPATVAFVIVAESPPASSAYFYNPDGKVGESLFSALMKQLDVKASRP